MTKGKNIPRSIHAEIPPRLYQELIEVAKNRSIDGDIDAARWLLDERMVLERTIAENEFAKLKKNKNISDQFYGKPCVICGKPADTIDHIIPISMNGSNDTSNLQPMCRSCNSKKKNRT